MERDFKYVLFFVYIFFKTVYLLLQSGDIKKIEIIF